MAQNLRTVASVSQQFAHPRALMRKQALAEKEGQSIHITSPHLKPKASISPMAHGSRNNNNLFRHTDRGFGRSQEKVNELNPEMNDTMRPTLSNADLHGTQGGTNFGAMTSRGQNPQN